MEVDSPNASISAARFAVDHRSINYPETQSHRRWRRVLIFIKAIVSLREGSRKRVDGLRKGDVQASLSSFKVFDLNMQPQSSLRVTERLISLDDKLLAQKDRKPAACAVCRAKKQKVGHLSSPKLATMTQDT